MKKGAVLIGSILIILQFLLLGGSRVDAAFLNYSDSSTGTLPQTPGTADTMQIDQFDLAIGTLNSVTVNLSDYFTWSFLGENTDGPNTISHNLSMDLAINSYQSGLLKDTLTRHEDNPLPTSDGTVDFGGTSGYTHNNSSFPPGLANTYILTGVDMAPFLGIGQVDFSLFGSSQSSSSDTTGNAAYGVLSNYAANVDVVYDYTPIPIPGAAWLFG